MKISKFRIISTIHQEQKGRLWSYFRLVWILIWQQFWAPTLKLCCWHFSGVYTWELLSSLQQHSYLKHCSPPQAQGFAAVAPWTKVPDDSLSPPEFGQKWTWRAAFCSSAFKFLCSIANMFKERKVFDPIVCIWCFMHVWSLEEGFFMPLIDRTWNGKTEGNDPQWKRTRTLASVREAPAVPTKLKDAPIRDRAHSVCLIHFIIPFFLLSGREWRLRHYLHAHIPVLQKWS